MAQRGGKRPGAGRKPGESTLAAQRVRAFIALKIEEEIAPLVTAQIEKAKTGDTSSFNTLMDQSFGKPAQALDLTSKGESLIHASPEEIKLATTYEKQLKSK